MTRADRWLGWVLLVVAVAWSWTVYETIPGPRSEWEPGPRLFPLLLGAALGVLALLLLALAYAPRRTRQPWQPALELAPLQRREARTVGATFALLLAYAFLLERVGFVLSTPLVLVAAMAGILGLRNWRGILLMAVGFTLGCYLVFHGLLEANLPRGSWVRLF